MKAILATLVITTSVVFVSREVKAQTTYTDLAAFQAATSDLTVVNFDVDDEGTSIPSGTLLTDEYDGFGIQFNSFNDGRLEVSDFAIRANSAPNHLLPFRYSFGGGGFEAVFDTPSTAFGLQFGGQQSELMHTFLELFDAADGLIASFDVQDDFGVNALDYVFAGVTSTTPIAKVQVAVGANDFVWFDDLMVGTAVPEPSSLLLAGGGLVFLFTRSRRCYQES